MGNIWEDTVIIHKSKEDMDKCINERIKPDIPKYPCRRCGKMTRYTRICEECLSGIKLDNLNNDLDKR